jgi:hypothetical protein
MRLIAICFVLFLGCCGVGVAQATPPPGESPAQSSDYDLARARLIKIYDRLKELGFTTGPGSVPLKPLLVQGKPVVAIFLGDRHESDYQQRAEKVISQLAAEFKISTLMLEGESFDPAAHARAAELVAAFDNAARDSVLSKEIRDRLEIQPLGEQPGGYATGDYRKVVKLGMPYPSRALGLESLNAEDLYYQRLRIYYQLTIELMGQSIGEKDGKLVITINEKPISESMAVFIAAHNELKLGKWTKDKATAES